MNRLNVSLFDEVLDNPIIPASGTFGFGYEFNDYYDINILGSISLKGTTLNSRYGNIQPRISECKSGLLNAIGLQNPGAKNVIEKELPKLFEVYKKNVIINIGGHDENEYLEVVKMFNNVSNILGLEINISCPNVKEGGMAFGTNKEKTYNLIKKIKEISNKKIIVKLSPNVTDIVEISKVVESANADAISLINTLVGLRIDLKTGKPILGVTKGGYSGPGIFPVSLRMVYEVSRNVKIPVIGMGGIETAKDVIEMMMAGASCVMVGSANLIDPWVCKKIIEDLPGELDKLNIKNIKDIIGGYK